MHLYLHKTISIQLGFYSHYLLGKADIFGGVHYDLDQLLEEKVREFRQGELGDIDSHRPFYESTINGDHFENNSFYNEELRFKRRVGGV